MHAPLSDEIKERLQGSTTATLTMQLFKRGLRNTFMVGVRRLNRDPGLVMVGEAYTLRMIPAREDIVALPSPEDRSHPQRRAIEECPPGAVLVVDCRKDVTAGTLGDILLTRLQGRGAAGMVTDGGMRDTPAVAELAIPVYAAGAAAPPSFVRHAAIDLDVPIACADVAVYPGDVLVGDGEGVVVIPRRLVDEVGRDAAEQELLEEWILEEVKAGRSIFGLYPPDEAARARYEAHRAGIQDA